MRAVQAGSNAGVLSPVQPVGNSLDVGAVGVVFFGALPHGYGHAFGLSVGCLGGLLVSVAGLSRFLPAPARPAVLGASVRLAADPGGAVVDVDFPGVECQWHR